VVLGMLVNRAEAWIDNSDTDEHTAFALESQISGPILGGCKSRRRFKDKQQEVKMDDEECENCNGSGSVRNDGRYKYSVECDTVDCPVCNGSGIAPPEPDYEDFVDIT
jgi:hypothetical protein